MTTMMRMSPDAADGILPQPSAEYAVVLAGVAYDYPSFRLGPIDLTLERGARCALVGRNGAGKTTLLSILAGQRSPRQGTGRVGGHDVHDERILIRQSVAFASDPLRCCPWMTVAEHFALLARFYDPFHLDAATGLADALELPLDKSLTGLSRGTSLKVALCSAWGQGAELLLLDEPTAGLDPIARVELLRQLGRQVATVPDLTVILATHVLEDLDYLGLTDLLVLREGACEHEHPARPLAPGEGSGRARELLLIDSTVSEL
jgi:ABC-2 type transport system ATP-binding protein